MNKMYIKSNTKGKLSKIIKGFVFSDPYVFVTEFYQNSYRAKATELKIDYDFEAGTLTFFDNGNGLRELEDILTLDYSNWTNTEEGFGIGFWSWLAFDMKDEDEAPTEVECCVRSGKYELNISKLKLLSDGEPSINSLHEHNEFVCGFKVTIKSELLKDEYVKQTIFGRIKEDGQLMKYNVYFNQMLIEKKDILTDVKGDCVVDFSNHLFDARIAMGDSAGRLNVFYEKRKVRSMYVYGYASGSIELKKGAINLKEPDRKDYAFDNKYYRFESKINDCIKKLYINMLKTSDDEIVAKYAHKVVDVLSISDYEKLLNIEDIFMGITTEERNIVDIENEPLSILQTYLDKTKKTTQLSLFEAEETEFDSNNIVSILNSTESGVNWISTGEINEDETCWLKSTIVKEELTSVNKIVINGKVWSKISNTKDYSQNSEEIKNTIRIEKTKKIIKKANVVNVISKARKKVWVKLSDIESCSDLISKAKYYGVKVFIAKNIMYEKVFESRNVPHISQIEDNIDKINISKNVEIKTSKEKRLLELLIPICKYYKLPGNTFLIGELEIKIETKLNDIVVDREHLRNKKDDIKVFAVTDGHSIILDRRALNLKRFTFSSTVDLGKNEFKVLMSILNIVAHELSHLLYGTTDNTIEHYETQEKIAEEIIMLYNSLS